MVRKLALLACLPLASLTAQITPLGADPALGPAVIQRNASNVAVTEIDQIELRPLATPGLYRVACTVVYSGAGNTSLLSGVLDLGVTPPVWTPDDHVDALNTANAAPGQDEFQLTMSPDQLVVAWDNYALATYPNVPVASNTFVCRRTSITVPFATADVRAVAGFNATWSDAHLGRALSGGRYEFFYGDVNGDISRAEIDPATGNLFSPSLVLSRPTGVVAVHSPFVLRDSTGAARALSFGEIRGGGGAPYHSNMLWTPSVTNTGVPLLVADGALFAGPGWFSNGSTNGGTFHYGAAIGRVYGAPFRAEHNLLADADLSSGSGILAGWTPIRPAGPGFVSAVAIGQAVQPYALSGVQGSLLLLPTVGITDLRWHDRYTGLAEWAFVGVPGFGGATLSMQIISLDLAPGGMAHAGNAASLRLP